MRGVARLRRNTSAVRQPAGPSQQVKVMGKCRCVTGILKLSNHLCVREDLARVRTCQLEQPP